jgi:hypothetical protein
MEKELLIYIDNNNIDTGFEYRNLWFKILPDIS